MSAFDQPVSVELEQEDWETIAGILSAGGTISRRLGELIAERTPRPLPLPSGVGAVVEAYAGKHLAVYVMCAIDSEGQYGWRPLDGSPWAHGGDLRVVRVLSEGVPWPA